MTDRKKSLHSRRYSLGFDVQIPETDINIILTLFNLPHDRGHFLALQANRQAPPCSLAFKGKMVDVITPAPVKKLLKWLRDQENPNQGL
ncbi:hypothetical protein L249_7023 [Ophiocordyceps polyrhachis-furcata BCC 54312]|uniref:Uncharacterized protein n=1 Tax=Ophiocordyceps polyrhachis-furcata BCC 54312 TaxID=1330021 RepID=A0A367LKJ2_9HYPO|nr:hypothetical protein L249_7023 [Ophiocordyceps polyrhachis-furcata BCC 54312]